MGIRRLILGGTLIAIAGGLLGAVLADGEPDPVAECTTSAERLWSRALDAQDMADVETLPALKELPACRDLTPEQRRDFHRRNAPQEDKVAGHLIRLALNEQEN